MNMNKYQSIKKLEIYDRPNLFKKPLKVRKERKFSSLRSEIGKQRKIGKITKDNFKYIMENYYEIHKRLTKSVECYNNSKNNDEEKDYLNLKEKTKKKMKNVKIIMNNFNEDHNNYYNVDNLFRFFPTEGENHIKDESFILPKV